MRISRPCYDKYHRCPGWAGGGMKYAKVERCINGFLDDYVYRKPLWAWRTHRCSLCGVIVLPYNVRWLDPTWYRYWRPRWYWERQP